LPHGGPTAVYCELVHDGLIAQCWRKDFSKSERIDYARRLERIESLKAEKRMRAGKFDPMEIFPQGATRDFVASKFGIGSGKQYEKEKYIVDNQASLSPEEFANWDEGKQNSISPP
jgi:ParB family chromosome partitioning protein